MKIYMMILSFLRIYATTSDKTSGTDNAADMKAFFNELLFTEKSDIKKLEETKKLNAYLNSKDYKTIIYEIETYLEIGEKLTEIMSSAIVSDKCAKFKKYIILAGLFLLNDKNFEKAIKNNLKYLTEIYLEFAYSGICYTTDSTCVPETFLYRLHIVGEGMQYLILENKEYSDINNETSLEITSKDIVKLRSAVIFKRLSGSIHNLARAIIRSDTNNNPNIIIQYFMYQMMKVNRYFTVYVSEILGGYEYTSITKFGNIPDIQDAFYGFYKTNPKFVKKIFRYCNKLWTRNI